jgi:hypothetical protein
MSPLALITASILLGMESLRVLRYSWLMSWVYSSTSFNFGTQKMSWLFSFLFIKFQVFSIGYRSGKYPDQSMTWKGWVLRMSLTLFEAWHGATF